ncbi:MULTISPECIES: alpha/beta hydrolase-fold protein [unclassified Spirosoma]|uniref:alpha/beta hydrolase-fold protein n=1 Tax=unclassified Spirosoma TaxID=2621999 RepID=UPI00095C3408|nr:MULTISPECIES: alpha/beta hydrolase-fold protein [unclassified Spirosoma]MBN8825520.1 alpha/beta hydrolase [Spirosoma sp.]OJW74227.1 MAG: esterase [Spirosoma sp. 48-14]
MKPFLLLVCVVFASYAKAQSPASITIGKIDSLTSSILNEKRKIWVYIPESAGGDVFAKPRYPVVYLLDGDAHFSSVVGMIEQLSQVNGNTVCPQMIVVGIPNTNRTRDLTPTHVENDPPFMGGEFAKPSGGGNAFLSFIEKELIPHIDSLYPTQPYRMLIGHSFGGLAVMNALISRPQVFNSYICIDPSMWYDRMNFLKTTEKALTQQKFAGKSLYLGIANTMGDGMTLAKLPKDTSATNRHIRSIFELDRHIKSNSQNGLRYKSRYYPDDTHSSAPLITEYDGLRFIFDSYSLKLSSKDFTDTTTALADKYAAHYARLSKQMGYAISPSEGQINAFGYQALQGKHYRKAESLFKLNIANYPNSYNVYDSYGDFFMACNDPKNAILQFQKALSLKENPASRQKLEALLKPKP